MGEGSRKERKGRGEQKEGWVGAPRPQAEEGRLTTGTTYRVQRGAQHSSYEKGGEAAELEGGRRHVAHPKRPASGAGEKLGWTQGKGVQRTVHVEFVCEVPCRVCSGDKRKNGKMVSGSYSSTGRTREQLQPGERRARLKSR